MVTLLGTTAEEVLAYEEWNLDGKNISSREDQEALALVLGRASSKVPKLRVVSANQAQLGKEGAKHVAEALKINTTLKDLKCAACACVWLLSAPADCTIRLSFAVSTVTRSRSRS